MHDENIVEMYWQRDERAIEETDAKYGRYLFKIAYSILADEEDGRESLNAADKAAEALSLHGKNNETERN